VTDRAVESKPHAFSLLDDPLLRLQRFLRLAPSSGLGAPRRALFFALVGWLPVVGWAVLTGHVGVSDWRGALVNHLGLHVRCLLAIPLLVLSGPLADRVLGMIVAEFPAAGLVREEDLDRYAGVVRSIERRRDSKLAWGVLVGLTVVATLATNRGFTPEELEALGWGANLGRPDFGATWSLYVVRPMFMLMQLAWLWRLLLTGMLYRGLAKLDLRLIPSHPDRVGGLGFLEFTSGAFALVVLALSIVGCSSAAQQILVHGVRLQTLQVPLAGLVVLLVLLFLSPMLVFGGPLRRARIRGRLQYGALAGRHVGGLHTRWIEGREVKDAAVLSAPEIGPAADVATLYSMATAMRPLPIGLRSLVGVLLPALAPVLVVATLEVPLKEILLKILGMLR
jgi:hypothetical protein